MKYNVAVIGTGYMARKHCEVLAVHQNARLMTVCSTEKSHRAGEDFKSRYGFAKSTTDYSSVLSDSNVDIVFVCSPDKSHTEQVCGALEAGKHVLCEKPLARTPAEFQRIRKQIQSSDRVLQVGMNCRFREQYVIPRRMVSSGELGSLRFLRGTYIVNTVASVHGGEKAWWLDYPADVLPFLHGGGIHCLDLLRWIAGPVESIFARSTGFELGAELAADTFSISMRFSGGAIGEFLVSASAFRPNDFSLELWLSNGSVLGTKVFRREHDTVGGLMEEITIEQKILDISLQFADLVRAIEDGSQPLNSFAEAYENFKVLQAIHHSIRSGQAVEVSDPVLS
jgi:UDP-N-acetyl-2-amino-2-deoxyglucuronate dehydrogenase